MNDGPYHFAPAIANAKPIIHHNLIADNNNKNLLYAYRNQFQIGILCDLGLRLELNESILIFKCTRPVAAHSQYVTLIHSHVEVMFVWCSH